MIRGAGNFRAVFFLVSGLALAAPQAYSATQLLYASAMGGKETKGSDFAMKITLQPPHRYRVDHVIGGKISLSTFWDGSTKTTRTVNYSSKTYFEVTQQQLERVTAEFRSKAKPTQVRIGGKALQILGMECVPGERRNDRGVTVVSYCTLPAARLSLEPGEMELLKKTGFVPLKDEHFDSSRVMVWRSMRQTGLNQGKELVLKSLPSRIPDLPLSDFDPPAGFKKARSPLEK